MGADFLNAKNFIALIVSDSSNAFAEDIQTAKDAGMNSHIAKPIDIPKMIATLTEVLQDGS